MGSYLSEPITEKISSEEIGEKLLCGASSMQGWRISQEDAHNCILDYDKNTAFFAVYDGHGGHEVALYCSEKFPNYLKDLKSYQENNIEQALEEAFLGFDGTIATPAVVAVLKEMANDKEAKDSDDDEENIDNLYDEATMPIEQVIEKYTNNLLSRKSAKDDGKPASPFLKSKTAQTSMDASEGCSSSSSDSSSATSSKVKVDELNSTSTSSSTTHSENGHSSSDTIKAEIETPAVKEKVMEQPEAVKVEQSNGENVTLEPSTPIENGTPKKGKALTKTKGVIAPVQRTRPKRESVRQMYAKLLDCPPTEQDDEDDDDDSEADDKTFVGTSDASSDDDDDENEGVNASLNDEQSSDDDDDDDDDEEEEEEEELSESTVEFVKHMVEEPGSDSGCTAVVAILKEKKLYVANAGDSRCIVSRDGKAVDMSFDHKPEDQAERDRIVKAGGQVTADGRVNGGLNLSRAIGDHAYKQNKELNNREQMITALPDIKTLEIDPKTDEFMVLACDGIWNFMSSQEVVDFIKPAIKAGTKLSHICEEMFDHCLAPNTMGDGTGCDNMTAIIVQFKNAESLKRTASEDTESTDNTKRLKTDDETITSTDAEEKGV